MVLTAPVTKNMHPPQAEWYQIVARHHREGAHGHVSGLLGDGSQFWGRIPAKIDIFVGFRPLPRAPVGTIMDETPFFGCKTTALNSGIHRGTNLEDWSTGWAARPV